MEEILTKETAKKLMEIKGEIRGIVFKTDVTFILKEKGEEGLKKLEAEMERLGYPFKYNAIKTSEFYPIGLRIISLLLIKQIFGFSEEKIEEMGSLAIKFSPLLRIITKLFLNFEKIFFSRGPELFKKILRVGEIIPVIIDTKKKEAIIRFKDLDLHPIYCRYLKGGLSSFFKVATGVQTITCQETKCTFQGDEYHEFLLKW